MRRFWRAIAPFFWFYALGFSIWVTFIAIVSCLDAFLLGPLLRLFWS